MTVLIFPKRNFIPQALLPPTDLQMVIKGREFRYNQISCFKLDCSNQDVGTITLGFSSRIHCWMTNHLNHLFFSADQFKKTTDMLKTRQLMRIPIKNISMVFAALILFSNFLPVNSALAQTMQDSISMQAFAGNEGYFKYGEWLLIWVELENSGQDQVASIEVRVPGEQRDGGLYSPGRSPLQFEEARSSLRLA